MGYAASCADGSTALFGTELVWKTEIIGMKIAESLQKRWVRWVWNHTPDCAQMSRLASQSIDRSIPLRIWLKMRLHYLICVWCQRYLKQLRFLHASAPSFDEHAGLLLNPTLSPAAKRRIIQRVRA